MRKIQLIAGLLLITGMGIFTSCKKDDNTPPTLTFIGGSGFVSDDVTLNVGELFKVGVNASSSVKLTNFKVVRTFNNNAYTVIDSTLNSESFTLTFTTEAYPEVGSEKWTFIVTDKNDESTELAFNVTTIATAGEINTFTAVLLGGQLNPDHGSFYATSNTVFNEANANLNQNKIDMVYYYGTNKHNSIVAPASTQLSDVPEFSYILDATAANHWNTTNQTKFKDVTSAVTDWSLVTNDALITANAVNMTDMFVNDLVANKIVAFETASTSANPGKKGLYKVISTGGTTGADRTITIEVKIQK
jgi:hypothetical protein